MPRAIKTVSLYGKTLLLLLLLLCIRLQKSFLWSTILQLRAFSFGDSCTNLIRWITIIIKHISFRNWSTSSSSSLSKYHLYLDLYHQSVIERINDSMCLRFTWLIYYGKVFVFTLTSPVLFFLCDHHKKKKFVTTWSTTFSQSIAFVHKLDRKSCR